MSFFKVDHKLATEDILESPVVNTKLRYVIDSNGVGNWIKPTKIAPTDSLSPLSCDYDEDIPW